MTDLTEEQNKRFDEIIPDLKSYDNGTVSDLPDFVKEKLKSFLADEIARTVKEAVKHTYLPSPEDKQAWIAARKDSYQEGKEDERERIREEVNTAAKVKTNLIDMETGKVPALYLRTVLEILTPLKI